MGSLCLLSLPLVLGAVGRGGGNATERAPGPRGGSPAPSGTAAPFWVRISPEFAAVPPGRSLWLNCSTSCPLAGVPRLRTQLRRGLTRSGPGWASQQLLDVRAWNSSVTCLVTCAGETREATARITAYSEARVRLGRRGEGGRGRGAHAGLTRGAGAGDPLSLAIEQPRSVVLDPPVLVGSKYTLRCHVTHAFPVGFMVVTLRRGGRVIYSESLAHFTRPDLANVTLTYQLRAGPRDFWQPVTCHARLHLGGLVVRSSSAPVMLEALAWSSESKALASASIAALLGILLVVAGAYLRRCLALKAQV
ncbi:intercellular adhesion molecule 4 isoform X1 [Oryctolagus cuniculus]|uniref:intercellular adhesion molecule 4 isoform X1 n=1 Tax=Oryctolagus cuniculus TaxID=9986 RepID=UPI0038799AE4